MNRNTTIVVKKTHTVKHNVISDENDRILYVSKAYHGTAHDKKIADLEDLKFPENSKTTLYQDTGYQGYAPENVDVKQPKKKSKNKKLTEEEKQENKKISTVRVKIEHVIGSIKVLRIVKDEIRIYKESTRNMIMKIACAIHNIKVSMREIIAET